MHAYSLQMVFLDDCMALKGRICLCVLPTNVDEFGLFHLFAPFVSIVIRLQTWVNALLSESFPPEIYCYLRRHCWRNIYFTTGCISYTGKKGAQEAIRHRNGNRIGKRVLFIQSKAHQSSDESKHELSECVIGVSEGLILLDLNYMSFSPFFQISTMHFGSFTLKINSCCKLLLFHW